MKTRGEILNMTEAEARAWVYQCPIDSTSFGPPDDPVEYAKFIERFNMVHWDCGLTRAGVHVSKPSWSGELIVSNLSI